MSLGRAFQLSLAITVSKMTCYPRHLVVLVFLLFVSLPNMFATHIIGGEMNYACLGANQYEISLTVYRDCYLGEALLDDTAYVAIYDQLGVLVLTVPMLLGEVDTVRQVDECLLSPKDLCIETTIYKDTVTLATKAGGYHIAYQRCCRNKTILNIVDPLNTGATYDIQLSERAMQQCNTSPVIKAWPPTFICANRPLLFDHAAFDKDGDSLAYKLCTPLDGGISLINPRPRPAFPPPYNNIQWNSPTYDLDNLLSGIPLTIDPITGLISGTPALTGQFVVGICVEEYRAGVLLSETRRDFQYNVIPCEDIAASFEQASKQCNDFQLTINNSSVGASHYLWKLIEGNTVLATSTDYIPNFSVSKEGTYITRLLVDPATPCVDSVDHIVTISSSPNLAVFTSTISGCADSLIVELTDVSDNLGLEATTWDWTMIGTVDRFVATGRNPSIVVKNSQSFEVFLEVTTSEGCILEAAQTVQATLVEDAATIAPPSIIRACQNSLVSLNPNFDPTLQYDWSNNSGISDPNAANPTVEVTTPTSYIVQISDATSACSFERIILVELVEETQAVEVNVAYACDGQTLTFQPNLPGNYEWDFGDGTTPFASNESTIIHHYEQIGSYSLQIKNLDPQSCTQDVNKLINIVPVSLKADFDWSGENCTDEGIELFVEDQSKMTYGQVTSWNWELSNGQTSMAQNPTFFLEESESLEATLTIELDNNSACISSKTIRIPPLLLESPNTETILSCKGNKVELNPVFHPHYTYVWQEAPGLETPNQANPSILVQEDQRYTVEIGNEYGCSVDKNVFVNIYPEMEVVYTEEVALCDSLDQVVLYAYSDQASRQWWISPQGDTLGMEPELVLTNPQAGQYRVILEDNNACEKEKTVDIKEAILALDYQAIYPLCKADTLQLDVINLDPEMLVTFQWEPENQIISGAKTNSPLLYVDQDQDFSFTATNQFGCMTSGNIIVSLQDAAIELAIESATTNIYKGESIQFYATENPNYSYTWSPAASLDNSTVSNPIASPTENTVYQVLVSNELGCTALDSISVSITAGICAPPYLFVPNAFTPNNDGENDLLFVRGTIISSLQFIIYDRWGDKVFESNNIEDGWDGKKNGKFLPGGAYGYYLYANCLNGENYYKQGNITLIR